MANKRPLMYLAEIVPAEEDFVKRVQHTYTATELKNLIATPITILPAPGPNKYYTIHHMFLYFVYIAPAYVLSDDPHIYLMQGNYVAGSWPTTLLLNRTLNTAEAAQPPAAPQDATTILNQPLTSPGFGTTENLNGNGTLLMVIYYTIEGDH